MVYLHAHVFWVVRTLRVHYIPIYIFSFFITPEYTLSRVSYPVATGMDGVSCLISSDS